MIQHTYPRVGVGALILDETNRVLLQLRNNPPEAGCWSIPGGKVEFMEKLEDAITRELHEELGVRIRVKKLLCVVDHIVPADNAHWVAPVFLAQIVSGGVANLEPNTIRQVKWIPIDSLPQNLTITTHSAIESYRQLGG